MRARQLTVKIYYAAEIIQHLSLEAWLKKQESLDMQGSVTFRIIQYFHFLMMVYWMMRENLTSFCGQEIVLLIIYGPIIGLNRNIMRWILQSWLKIITNLKVKSYQYGEITDVFQMICLIIDLIEIVTYYCNCQLHGIHSLGIKLLISSIRLGFTQLI